MEPLFKIVRKPIPVPKGAIRITVRIVKADGTKVYSLAPTFNTAGRPVSVKEARNMALEYAIDSGIDDGCFTEEDFPNLFFEWPPQVERG